MFSNRVLFSKKEIYFVRMHILDKYHRTHVIRILIMRHQFLEYRRNHGFDRERKEKDKVK